MGGMVLETNMNEIVAQIEAQNRLEKSEVSCVLARAEKGVCASADLCCCGTLGNGLSSLSLSLVSIKTYRFGGWS